MKILGIDPGIGITGFGLIETSSRASARALDFGVITTTMNAPLPGRLKELYDSLQEVFESTKPDVVSIEKLFFSKNITTGIAVAHGRGVILLACRKFGVRVYEYTPLQVKQAVVGYGRAEKHQVMDMVKRLCRLPAPPKPDDAADAVALAICHARSSTSLLFRGDQEECSTI